MFAMTAERAASIELARKESNKKFSAQWNGRTMPKAYEKEYRKQWAGYEMEIEIRERQHAKSEMKYGRKAEAQCKKVERCLKEMGYVSCKKAGEMFERTEQRLEGCRDMFNAGKGTRTRKRCHVGSEISFRRPSASNNVATHSPNTIASNKFCRGERSHLKKLVRIANDKAPRIY